MKRVKWNHLALILAILGFVYLVSCAKKEDALQKIRSSGKITVLTRNNAHCYYIYRDEPMGFEYDLAVAFSKYLGAKLKVATPSWEGLIEDLEKGKGDFVAAGMSITPSRQERVDFSEGYLVVTQYIITHKSNQAIKGIRDLNGKTIHVRKGTSYEELLNGLKGRGLNIKVKIYDDMPTEELIRMVAEKEIEVTMSDSQIALLNRRYYPDIKLAFPVGGPVKLGWAVKKGETALLGKINEFFRHIKADGTFARIYNKYFAYVDTFDYVDLKRYHRSLESRLPKYKAVIQQAAKKYGFDWRLIAAMIYQESHFDPRARSHTGVRGIMQLTLDTARDMGIKSRLEPEQSIRAGVRYFKKLYDMFGHAREPDRLLLALASYNVGYRHVQDAQKIAKQKGLDPNSWAALEETLPLLCHRKYYKKTRSGYCRGREPVRYVKRILTYYDILKREAMG
ncbi:MAG: membrane-bound lytic murein transglycosylase MltF [Deltaproteobacteria bacterium]|nr:membrane-bound lytic murein transglycosylase MltF [Deltaproteobacteria bacterium]MBW1936298.1 membrane-bound lytic murein transglycosylase MltF [Deltaproteobacteria bacterium]